MKNTDIALINKDELVDISEVKINSDLSKKERIIDYINQIKNPYCFKCGGVTVKMSFADTNTTLEENLELFLQTL